MATPLPLCAISLVLDVIRTVAVVVALVYGWYQLKDLGRKRGAETLDRMLEQWHKTLKAQKTVIAGMPEYPGDQVTQAIGLGQALAEKRPQSFAELDSDIDEVLEAAGKVVFGFNDLGRHVEKKAVDQRDFFGIAHVPVVRNTELLVPLVLLASACNRSRWGLRLRRMQIGAIKYHETNRVHRPTEIRLRGQVLVAAKSANRVVAAIRELRLLFRLIPSLKRSYKEDAELVTQVQHGLEEHRIDCDAVLERIKPIL